MPSSGELRESVFSFLVFQTRVLNAEISSISARSLVVFLASGKVVLVKSSPSSAAMTVVIWGITGCMRIIMRSSKKYRVQRAASLSAELNSLSRLYARVLTSSR